MLKNIVSCCACVSSLVTGSLLTHTKQIGGSWVRGNSAGGCRNNSSYSNNPKIWLKVREGGEVLMSLLQHGPWSSLYNPLKGTSAGKTQQHPYYQAIALHVWKVWRFLKGRFSCGFYCGPYSSLFYFFSSVSRSLVLVQ